MLVSRYPLGAIGGHCDKTGFPRRDVRTGESGPEKGKLVGVDQARQAVRLQVKYGADVIKMCVSGGVLSLGDDVGAPQMTDEEIAAAVDEAHRLGRKTAAHAHGDLAARSAIKGGIDSIEHGSFMTDETLALMKSKGTDLVPTLMAGEWVTRPDAEPLPAGHRREGQGGDLGPLRHVPPRAQGRRARGLRNRRGRVSARYERARVRPDGRARHDAAASLRTTATAAASSAWPRRSGRSRRARTPTSSPSPEIPSRTFTPRRKCSSS